MDFSTHLITTMSLTYEIELNQLGSPINISRTEVYVGVMGALFSECHVNLHLSAPANDNWLPPMKKPPRDHYIRLEHLKIYMNHFNNTAGHCSLGQLRRAGVYCKSTSAAMKYLPIKTDLFFLTSQSHLMASMIISNLSIHP